MKQRIHIGAQVTAGFLRRIAPSPVRKWCFWLAICCLPFPALNGWCQLVPQEAYTARKAAQEAVRASNARVADTDTVLRQSPLGSGNVAVKNSGFATAPPADASHSEAGKQGGSSRAREIRGKRDPFASIIRAQTDGGSGCANGKKCLEVGQIVLKGVVKTLDGMVAMVENQRRRSYFLREKDPIFNAEVVRITKDSIVFRENVIDKIGHIKVREVVKRMGVAGPAA